MMYGLHWEWRPTYEWNVRYKEWFHKGWEKVLCDECNVVPTESRPSLVAQKDIIEKYRPRAREDEQPAAAESASTIRNSSDR